MPGVENRGLLHRNLPVPVVLVSRDSDDDDRPLQALRLMHRRHEHGIMSRRLFVYACELTEVSEQSGPGDWHTRPGVGYLVLSCVLAQRVYGSDARFR